MAWPTVAIDTTSMDAGTDSPATARAQINQMAINLNSIKDAKGAVSGIAPLDAAGLLPTANLPITPATKGGLGQSVYAVGDVFYANTTTTIAKLAAGAAGYALTSNGAGNAPSYQQVGGFAPGTRMSFNQTAAPIGWTKDTTAALNDSILRIVTGTVGSGGTTAFSTFNGQTSVGATTLSTAQIPSHAHSYASANTETTNITGSLSGLQYTTNAGTGQTTSYQGGSGSHTHSMTTDIKYNDFIIASKD
jgi:hypothetical protein